MKIMLLKKLEMRGSYQEKMVLRIELGGSELRSHDVLLRGRKKSSLLKGRRELTNIRLSLMSKVKVSKAPDTGRDGWMDGWG